MKRTSFYLLMAFTLLLTACQGTPSPLAPSLTPSLPIPSLTPSPTPKPPTPTPAPRTLVICTGEEPQSLYVYSQPTVAAWNVLEAIYDGPIDERGYVAQPVILQKLPSLADGDATISSTPVKEGDEVIDASGSLVTLAKGVTVYPAGCNGMDCATPWDGKSDLKMDQLTVTYKLLPGLVWSDGQPLKASDSVFSYHLAAEPATPVSKYDTDRTASYKALDDLTAQWVGIPGNLSPSYLANFWLPLPQHLWGSMSASELLKAEASTVKPIGWGPYVIDEWVKGDHITLHKNPYYFRAQEGLPKFDTLVYRFVGTNPTAGLTALLAGECDIVDRSAQLDGQLSTLLELQNNKKLQAFFTAGPEVEMLDFGIKPASYDNGYNPAAGDRPDFFGDVRTRQAFADCMDRQTIVDQLLKGQSQVIDTYLPPQNPLYDPTVAHYGFDVAKGSQLLDEVGWKDPDNDPTTPRVAQNVTGIPNGTPLVVNYWTTQATLRKQVATILSQSLAQCGIQLNVRYDTPDNLFAQGPQGPVFGRQFDLVDFSWQGSNFPQCFLFQTVDIPTAANHWLGANVTGYSNPQFDQACAASMHGLPGQPAYTEANKTAEEIFANDLPAIPLYLLVKAAAARPDLCGFALDPSARSDFWNLEAFDYGQGCNKK
jgi:peptide/nickel transport system substrate-binding protein